MSKFLEQSEIDRLMRLSNSAIRKLDIIYGEAKHSTNPHDLQTFSGIHNYIKDVETFTSMLDADKLEAFNRLKKTFLQRFNSIIGIPDNIGITV